MKISDLENTPVWEIIETSKGDFKVKNNLTFDEKIRIVTSVLNSVMENPIVEGIAYDRYLSYEYLLLYYTLVATDIEISNEDLKTPKEIINKLYTNEINYYLDGQDGFSELYAWINELLKQYQQYQTSFLGTCEVLLNTLTDNLAPLKDLLENMDSENVMDKILEASTKKLN